MRKLSLLGVVVVTSLVLSGCTHIPTTQPAENDAMLQENATDEAMMEAGSEGSAADQSGATVDLSSEQTSDASVALNAQNFSFSTKEIRVKRGANLTMMVTNTSGIHDFVIDELSVNSGTIAQGETVEVVIPTDTVGEFEYYCSVGNHRAMGMKGTLIIEE